MSASLSLFLDLGDMFTKGLAAGAARCESVRFPSVVARTLLRGGREMEGLALNDGLILPRLSGFESRKYPRTRSFRGSAEFVRVVGERPPQSAARFAGGIAAVYGADRRLLGVHPTKDNVDALVRKAFLLVAPAERCDVEIVFVVDVGRKADVVLRYAAECPRDVIIEIHNYRRKSSRNLSVSARGRCIDAMACARAALPPEVAIERAGRTLVLDVGYLRSKFAVLSQSGCDHQEQVEGLGVSECVYRILRDGQDQGLMEDEFAVVRALEACPPERFEIAGRRFDVRKIFESARATLEDELVRAARRIVLHQLERRGETCRAVAIIGGGARVVGSGVADRLKSELGLVTWVGAADLLLEGARRIVGSE